MGPHGAATSIQARPALGAAHRVTTTLPPSDPLLPVSITPQVDTLQGSLPFLPPPTAWAPSGFQLNVKIPYPALSQRLSRISGPLSWP